MKRCIILMMDSFGIGGAPDAAKFGDAGADTLDTLPAGLPGRRNKNRERPS